MSLKAFDSQGLVKFDNIDLVVMNFFKSHIEDVADEIRCDVIRRMRFGRRLWLLARIGRGAIDFLSAVFFVISIGWFFSVILLDFRMMDLCLAGLFAELLVEGLLRISIQSLSRETNMIAHDILVDVTEELNRIVLATRRGLPAGDSDV